MFKTTAHTVIAAATLLAISAAAVAGPLDAKRLPADTRWVIHVDFEQVRTTTTGRFLMSDECGLDLDEARDDMIEELGFDLFAESMDLTLHGAGESENDAVIILTATPAVEQTLQYLQDREPSYEMLIVDDYELHTWNDHDSDQPMFLHMDDLDRGTRRRAVLSHSMSRLLLTLTTLKGNAPDITRVRTSPLTISPRPGSLLYAQASSLHFLPEVELDKNLTEAAGRVTFEISELDDTSRLDLACTADNPERAQTVSEILQGLIALGKLVSSEDRDLRMMHHVLLATKTSAAGNEVGLSFAIPSEELKRMMRDGHDDHHQRGHHHRSN